MRKWVFYITVFSFIVACGKMPYNEHYKITDIKTYLLDLEQLDSISYTPKITHTLSAGKKRIFCIFFRLDYYSKGNYRKTHPYQGILGSETDIEQFTISLLINKKKVDITSKVHQTNNKKIKFTYETFPNEKDRNWNIDPIDKFASTEKFIELFNSHDFMVKNSALDLNGIIWSMDLDSFNYEKIGGIETEVKMSNKHMYKDTILFKHP